MINVLELFTYGAFTFLKGYCYKHIDPLNKTKFKKNNPEIYFWK